MSQTGFDGVRQWLTCVANRDQLLAEVTTLPCCNACLGPCPLRRVLLCGKVATGPEIMSPGDKRWNEKEDNWTPSALLNPMTCRTRHLSVPRPPKYPQQWSLYPNKVMCHCSGYFRGQGSCSPCTGIQLGAPTSSCHPQDLQTYGPRAVKRPVRVKLAKLLGDGSTCGTNGRPARKKGSVQTWTQNN